VRVVREGVARINQALDVVVTQTNEKALHPRKKKEEKAGS